MRPVWRQVIIWTNIDLMNIRTFRTKFKESRNAFLLSKCISECRLQSVGHSLRWHHNEHDDVLNHQPYHCLLNLLFRRRSKKTSKLRVTGLCAGNSPGTAEFTAQWPVTRKVFPFDDVIMFVQTLNVLWSDDYQFSGHCLPKNNWCKI